MGGGGRGEERTGEGGRAGAGGEVGAGGGVELSPHPGPALCLPLSSSALGAEYF